MRHARLHLYTKEWKERKAADCRGKLLDAIDLENRDVRVRPRYSPDVLPDPLTLQSDPDFLLFSFQSLEFFRRHAIRRRDHHSHSIKHFNTCPCSRFYSAIVTTSRAHLIAAGHYRKPRSDERRVGKGCVRTCRYLWS